MLVSIEAHGSLSGKGAVPEGSHGPHLTAGNRLLLRIGPFPAPLGSLFLIVAVSAWVPHCAKKDLSMSPREGFGLGLTPRGYQVGRETERPVASQLRTVSDNREACWTLPCWVYKEENGPSTYLPPPLGAIEMEGVRRAIPPQDYRRASYNTKTLAQKRVLGVGHKG